MNTKWTRFIKKIKEDQRGISIMEALLCLAVFALITWGAGMVFKQEAVGTPEDKGTVYTMTGKMDEMVNSIEVVK